jgi:hypothetical protein
MQDEHLNENSELGKQLDSYDMSQNHYTEVRSKGKRKILKFILENSVSGK